VSAVTVDAGVPLALRSRLESAGRTALYIVICLALGILHLLLLLPLLVLRSDGVWRLAELERKAGNRFLRTHIPPMPSRGAPERSVLALLALRLPTAAASL